MAFCISDYTSHFIEPYIPSYAASDCESENWEDRARVC
jgi:hypothetical protein